MEWDEIKAELKLRLPCRDVERRDEWLNGLTESNGGHHLGFCLLLDLRSGNVEAETLARVFDALQTTSACGKDQLHNALCKLDRDASDLLWDARARRYTVHCAKLIEAGDFVAWYRRPQGGLPTRRGAVLASFEQVFWDTDERQLPVLDRPWSGSRNRVWVFPVADFDLLTNAGMHDLPKRSVEALGLDRDTGNGENGGPLMGMVIYPRNFQTEFVQPSTLDARWTGDSFFVPFHSPERWGKTCHTFGEAETLRERVHGPLSSNLDGFAAKRLGEAIGVRVNRSVPLQEVRKRLADLHI